MIASNYHESTIHNNMGESRTRGCNMTPDHDASATESPITRRTLLRQASVGAGATVLGVGALSGTAAATFCARTPGYWKNHFDAWPRGDEVPLNNDLCENYECLLLTHDETISYGEALDILNTPPRGDKAVIMARHLIAALLNIRAGATDCVTGGGNPVYDARRFLGEYATVEDGELTSGSRRWHGYEEAKDELDAYNNGRRCACKGE